MNEEPLISICCITYNHGKYIEECLESFVSQNVSFLFEIVISNDVSPDNTQEIIERYKEKYPNIIRDISPKQNLGAMKNFYYALSQCRGKYIAYCEGDDYWIDKNKLQKEVDFLEANPKIGLCYTLSKKYIQKKGIFLKKTFGSDCCSYKDLFFADLIPTQTICFKKSEFIDYLKTVKPECRDWKMGDLPLLLWFSIKSEIGFLPYVTSIYRVLDSSVNHQENFSSGKEFIDSSYNVKLFYYEKFSLDYKKEDIDNRYIYNLFTKAFMLNDYDSFNCYFKLYKGKKDGIKFLLFRLISRYKMFFLFIRYLYGFAHA